MSWWLKRSVPQESGAGALEKETLLYLLDLIEKVVEKLVRVLVNDALMTPRRCSFPSP
jgi:hypothetical protein